MKTLIRKILIISAVFLFFGTSAVLGIDNTNKKTQTLDNSSTLSQVLFASGDSMIVHNGPNNNFGSSSRMDVRNEYGATAGWEVDGLIKFDLSSISQGTSIDTAKLKLYYYEWTDNNPAGDVLNLYRVTSNWDENTVTWNNQPTCSPSPTTSALVPAEEGNWIEWIVTSDVKAFIAGSQTNFGWKITDITYWGSANIPVTRFKTKESGENIPRLDITTGSGGDKNNPPYVSISYPKRGINVTGVIDVRGVAFDPNCNEIEWVMISIDNGDFEETTLSEKIDCKVNWSYQLDTNTVEDGEHFLSVVAYDGKAQSASSSVKFMVKNQEEPEEKVSDLSCQGALNWNKVKPGKTVSGNFTVSNIGDSESPLNWIIVSYPSWGEWTFSSMNGSNLTPEISPILVDINIVAPDDKETNFTGGIKILNTENISDYEIIQVRLNTPKSIIINPLFQLLQSLLELFPVLQNILNL